MPYVRCGGCGLISYAPRSGGSCPNCGAPVNLLPADVNGSDPARRLDALLRLTRELLDVDVAMLSEIAGGREVVRLAAGVWPGVGSPAGTALPFEDTICREMLEGRIGNVVCDTHADVRVRHLPPTTELGVRAWLGVPISLTDAELYVLCCLSREARPSFGEREVRLLRGLGESLRAELHARARLGSAA